MKTEDILKQIVADAQLNEEEEIELRKLFIELSGIFLLKNLTGEIDESEKNQLKELLTVSLPSDETQVEKLAQSASEFLSNIHLDRAKKEAIVKLAAEEALKEAIKSLNLDLKKYLSAFPITP